MLKKAEEVGKIYGYSLIRSSYPRQSGDLTCLNWSGSNFRCFGKKSEQATERPLLSQNMM